MSLITMFEDVLASSGVLELLALAPAWMALDLRQLIFAIATPVFIGITLLEYRRIKHDPARFNLREAVRNFMLGAGYQTTELLFAGLLVFPLYAFAYHYRLFEMKLTVWTALATFVLVDFTYYWLHRASHRVRWFWAAHVVHHSSERMNFSTAMRQSALNVFIGYGLFFMPMALLGFNPVWIGVCYALSLVYQFFIHTTLVKRLPAPVEWIMNTPSHHRVHHGRNRECIDSNYAGVFIIWDRLFGSFVDERGKGELHYGVTRPPANDGFLTMWTHEYQAMFRDMARPGSLWQRLQHLWRAPEWERPETKRER